MPLICEVCVVFPLTTPFFPWGLSFFLSFVMIRKGKGLPFLASRCHFLILDCSSYIYFFSIAVDVNVRSIYALQHYNITGPFFLFPRCLHAVINVCVCVC